MAIIPDSIRLTGFIAPTDSTDTFAVTNPTWGLGGLRRVSGTTERDSITTGRRESGMLVFSENDDTYYKLGTGLTNSDWTEFISGTAGGFLNLSGGTVSGTTYFTDSVSSNSFSGGTYFSGGTDLYDIFSTSVSNGLTKIGDNITFGGTLTGDTTLQIDSNLLTFSGGNTLFTENISASTINLTSTLTPQILMAPVNAAAPSDNSIWFTTSGGTTILNYRTSGLTKSVELT